MNGFGRIGGTLAAVGVLAFALLIVPALAAPAQASPVPFAGSNTQQWAYGAEKWVNVTINLPNATYTQKAFFGWQVIFTATNTSSTTQAWEVQRTMAGSFYADYCQPSCASPTTHGNVTVVGWEKDTGFANLTTAATVYENGVAQVAVGILNASFENAANLTESLTLTIASGPVTGSSSGAFDVAGAAHGSVQFSPALGLAPLNLTNGTTWNSSSAFSSSGAWAASYFVSHTPFIGAGSSSSGNVSGSVAHSGMITLMGSDMGTVTLANGVTVPVVVLLWTGPFDDVDGVILIPHDFDMFGSGTHDWSGSMLGSEAVATSNLDVAFDAAHHLRVVASATAYGSVDSQFGMGSTTGGMQASPMASTAPSTIVQAQPEPVTQAEQSAACLVGSCGAAAAHPVAALFVGLIVVGALAAVGVLGVVLYLRYRRGRGPVTAVASGMSGSTMPPAGVYAEPMSSEPPQRN